MHIAFILDGNRRWAKAKFMPKAYGHKKGVENLENLLGCVAKHGIKIVTAWALSTENLKRSKEELDDLFLIIEEFCKKKELYEKNQINFTYIGNIEVLPESTKNAIYELMKFTQNFNSFKFQVAINYGGKDEIVRAVNKAIEKGEKITAEIIEQNLDTSGLQDPELIVRTGGYKRLSGFMMWQSSYSELYFTDTLWPDFNEKELIKALEFYKNTKRNFGE